MVELTSPDHQHEIRRQVIEYRFETTHDLRRLHRVGARADAEIDVRLGNVELPEKGVFHGLIIVLPGVHETRVKGMPVTTGIRASRARSS